MNVYNTLYIYIHHLFKYRHKHQELKQILLISCQKNNSESWLWSNIRICIARFVFIFLLLLLLPSAMFSCIQIQKKECNYKLPKQKKVQFTWAVDRSMEFIAKKLSEDDSTSFNWKFSLSYLFKWIFRFFLWITVI